MCDQYCHSELEAERDGRSCWTVFGIKGGLESEFMSTYLL